MSIEQEKIFLQRNIQNMEDDILCPWNFELGRHQDISEKDWKLSYLISII